MSAAAFNEVVADEVKRVSRVSREQSLRNQERIEVILTEASRAGAHGQSCGEKRTMGCGDLYYGHCR